MISQRAGQPRLAPANIMSKGRSAVKQSNPRVDTELEKPKTGLMCIKPVIPHPAPQPHSSCSQPPSPWRPCSLISQAPGGAGQAILSHTSLLSAFAHVVCFTKCSFSHITHLGELSLQIQLRHHPLQRGLVPYLSRRHPPPSRVDTISPSSLTQHHLWIWWCRFACLVPSLDCSSLKEGSILFVSKTQDGDLQLMLAAHR